MITVLTAAALAMASSLCGAQTTGYTSRAAFDDATTGYVQHTIVGFDSQADGSSAGQYNGMSIAGSGLDSSANARIQLPLTATGAQPSPSSPHSLGTSHETSQFLAGNSDIITFNFSAPVQAFGLYLIGNPSPTGNPAIPFWRLTVNISRTSLAYSATDPLYSLGPGNDVYFLGIVSNNEPFTEAVLYSDNDYAACYSFNVDDVVYAALPDEVSILDAKAMESGPVRVTAVVSRVHQDRFNIQDAERSAGIAVMGEGTARGKSVTVLGNVGVNSEQERVIELAQILTQTDSIAPRSLAMNTLSVCGGSTTGLQAGVPGSLGPNNVGMDITICGRVTAIDTEKGEWITVDDGAGIDLIMGIKGVVVLGAVNSGRRHVGQYVTVRGSATVVELEPGRLGPAIRVAEVGDITP